MQGQLLDTTFLVFQRSLKHGGQPTESGDKKLSAHIHPLATSFYITVDDLADTFSIIPIYCLIPAETSLN